MSFGLDGKSCNMKNKKTIFETQTIVTENIEKTIWEYLERFTYTDLVKNYAFQLRKKEIEDKVINNISSSILQAKEYYLAAKRSTIQISPLLVYYGTINLFSALYSLKTGEIAEIENHGMFLCKDYENTGYISECRMKGQNPAKGALSVFSKELFDVSDVTQLGMWSLKELLSCIPDIENDFQEIFGKDNLHVLPIKKEKFDGLELHTIERTYLKRYKTAKGFMNDVPGFLDRYMDCSNSFRDFIVHLWIKQGSIQGITVKSIEELNFLPIYLRKNGKKVNLPILLYNYMALFILASLCRYCPDKWNPFVLRDTTGERRLLVKYIHYCERAIPNFVLNEIHAKNYIFVTDKLRMEQYKENDLNYDEIRRIAEEIVEREMGSVLR